VIRLLSTNDSDRRISAELTATSNQTLGKPRQEAQLR